MRVLVTVVTLFFLGVQAQSEWSYTGKLPPGISRQGDKTAHLCWVWVLPYGFTCVLLCLNEQIDFQPR